MKLRNFKSLTALIAILLVMGACVGTTLAFLIDSTDSVVNTFNPTEVKNEVVEKFENNVKTNVQVKNTGDIDAYIRAMVVVTWKDAQGNVYPAKPAEDADYSIVWWNEIADETLQNDKWVKGSDGFYYYKSPVEPGESTGVLFTGCKPVVGKTPIGYGLNVEIIAQSIQAEPASAVANAWGVTVDANGAISK